ncbi:MAG: hypothetical protein ABI406_01605 [Ktedonobacteraceae bacterium]
MPERMSRNAKHQFTISASGNRDTPTPVATDFEQLMEEARPRLLRSARMNGVVPDALDDVVQEILLEAWRYLDHFQARGSLLRVSIQR